MSKPAEQINGPEAGTPTLLITLCINRMLRGCLFPPTPSQPFGSAEVKMEGRYERVPKAPLLCERNRCDLCWVPSSLRVGMVGPKPGDCCLRRDERKYVGAP